METHDESMKFIEREENDSKQLQKQREDLVHLQSELRKAYNITSAANINGAFLKAIEDREAELREARHTETIALLNFAVDDCTKQFQACAARDKAANQSVVTIKHYQEVMSTVTQTTIESHTELREVITTNAEEHVKNNESLREDIRKT